jgi:hypothetical protein
VDLEPWIIATIVVVVGAVVVAVFLLYKVMKVGKKKKEETAIEVVETERKLPITKEHTITLENAKKAQGELKTLDIEREIISYAIRRLYEAQAEGKLSEEERDRLASGYKEKMVIIKDAMARNESVVALHELESMQDDLIKLFNDRFDELGAKIEDLRTRLEIKPIQEIPIPTETAPTEETPKKEKRKEGKPPTPTPKKTEAEQRIEKIKEEVEKVLEKLGQIEAEG